MDSLQYFTLRSEVHKPVQGLKNKMVEITMMGMFLCIINGIIKIDNISSQNSEKKYLGHVIGRQSILLLMPNYSKSYTFFFEIFINQNYSSFPFVKKKDKNYDKRTKNDKTTHLFGPLFRRQQQYFNLLFKSQPVSLFSEFCVTCRRFLFSIVLFKEHQKLNKLQSNLSW